MPHSNLTQDIWGFPKIRGNGVIGSIQGYIGFGVSLN